jgi:hypothetical protein
MRKIQTSLLSLLLPLLLTACVDDSASYYPDGSAASHTLTVHRAQQHFWSDEVSVELIMSRMPDCQRRVTLEQMPAEDVEIELYSGGDNTWTLRAGKQAWQVETQTCTQFAEAKGEPGELVGVFRAEGSKFVFAAAVLVPAEQSAAPTTAATEAPPQEAPPAPAAPAGPAPAAPAQ